MRTLAHEPLHAYGSLAALHEGSTTPFKCNHALLRPPPPPPFPRSSGGQLLLLRLPLLLAHHCIHPALRHRPRTRAGESRQPRVGAQSGREHGRPSQLGRVVGLHGEMGRSALPAPRALTPACCTSPGTCHPEGYSTLANSTLPPAHRIPHSGGHHPAGPHCPHRVGRHRRGGARLPHHGPHALHVQRCATGGGRVGGVGGVAVRSATLDVACLAAGRYTMGS